MANMRRKRTRYTFSMAGCRVSFTDQDKTGHAVKIEAESLYEAVALAAKTRS
jgi:hypothetical protein